MFFLTREFEFYLLHNELTISYGLLTLMYLVLMLI